MQKSVMVLTESRLRTLAEERGYPVSHMQFQQFWKAGLLPEPQEGRWSEDTVDRLVIVRRLSETVRSLPRRVIRLRDHLNFPVEPEKLRQAMVDLIPLIGTPATKMRRIDAACVYWGNFEAAGGPPLKGMTLPHGWKPPRLNQWQEILQEGDAAYFDRRAGMQYYFVQAVLPVYVANTPYNLDDILEEEQVTLLTIRDLAAWKRLREESAKSVARQAAMEAEIEREKRCYEEQRR